MNGMNESRLLLDTNTLIFLTAGGSKIPASLENELDKSGLFISFVTEIELFGNPALPADEEKMLRAFLFEKINVIDLCENIKKETAALRRTTSLTFPDCIVAATAIVHDVVLLTADTVLLRIIWPGYQAKNFTKYK